MNKKSKTSNKSKKSSFLIFGAVVAISAVVVIVIGNFVYSQHQNNKRVQQIRITDEDLQKFGDTLEKSFPSQVHREKYCRHDGVKLGKGALRCITRIGIETTYTSEGELINAIGKINQSLVLVPYFNFKDTSIPTKNVTDKVSNSGLVRFSHRNTGMLCNADYTFVHFDSLAIERRGEFNFSAHCTAGPLQKPIYKLRD